MTQRQLFVRNPMRVRRGSERDVYQFFTNWYKRSGHWIYSSMGKALEVWKSRGIEGLPPYPGRTTNPIARMWRLTYKGSKTGRDSIVTVRAPDYQSALKRGREITPRLKPHSVVLIRESNPLKFERCVQEVKRRGGRVNPYAVCTAAGTRRKRNPLRSGEADSVAARELELFAENDGDLYRQRFMPIIKNLTLKLKKGVYDPEKAVKLWMYFVDDAARKYVKEFSPGSSPSQMFNRATRLAVARRFESHERERIKNGEYS